MSGTNSSAINAEIIAIGTEILLGEITDTNSVYLARQLRDLGINLFWMTSVGDNEGRITQAIRNALGRAHVVITCGGLGPTIDDMTRQGVATAAGRELEFHPELLDEIRMRFQSFRAAMTENNTRQAFVPGGAIVVENPVGTAPSFIVEQGDHCIISLPGVPREMKFLFESRIVPYLRQRYELGETVIKARVLKTAGIGESMLDSQIGDDLLTASNPTVGLAAHSGQVDVRITAKAATVAEAGALIAGVEATLHTRIGSHIFGADEDTLDGALATALGTANATLCIAEAGVTPVLSQRANVLRELNLPVMTIPLMDVATARNWLGASVDASVRGLAEAVAARICQDDTSAVAVVAVSGDQGMTDNADTDERTALAVAFGGQVRSRSYGFGGFAPEVQQFLVTWAWGMAWRLLGDVS